MVSPASPNQSNSQDDQNYDIDIDDVYQDFIQEIDANRSLVNMKANLAILSSLTKDNITGLTKYLKIEQNPQESRCHAFFRLIGFPVVGQNADKMYNPGLDIIFDSTRTINLDYKLQVVQNPLSGFYSLSNTRENFVQSINKIFSLNQSIDASTLALSSSVSLRHFLAPLEQDNTPLDTVTTNQSYKVDFSGRVGANNKILLNNYQDVSGNSPIKLTASRFHLIKPFIVDPRIDFSVCPSARLVAIPFVPDKSKTLISENTYVKRPLLEKVIRDRITVFDHEDTLGTASQDTIDYIKSVEAIQDQDIIQSVLDVYKLGEQTQFANFLRIINTMINKLVAAQNTIAEAQSQYYWLPVPTITGPEGGNTTQGVLLSSAISANLITPADQNIINAALKANINQINAQTATLGRAPDSSDFTFSHFSGTFNSDTTDSLGDINQNNLDSLNKKRKQILDNAGDALRTIEIIMGEFSGLGLCDILAILGAMYLMPEADLLGLLDDDALSRMNIILKTSKGKSDITSSLTSLTNYVKDFYTLMDKIYQDQAAKNGLSS